MILSGSQVNRLGSRSGRSCLAGQGRRPLTSATRIRFPPGTLPLSCRMQALASEAGRARFDSSQGHEREMTPSRPRERGASLVTRRWRVRVPQAARGSMRPWFKSRMRECQSRDPGAIPGGRSAGWSSSELAWLITRRTRVQVTPPLPLCLGGGGPHKPDQDGSTPSTATIVCTLHVPESSSGEDGRF